MAFNKKDAGSDLIVNSIGICLAEPNDKKKPSKIVIAYKLGDDVDSVKFLFIKPPAKGYADRTSLLGAIAKAEDVGNVTYVSYDGQAKDIYVCREEKGRVTDVIERDYERNAYPQGYTEVFSSALKFSVKQGCDYAKSLDKCEKLEISAEGVDAGYEKTSYEYAVINAYNACLLGSIFECEELQIETRSGEKVKFEFRKSNSTFVVQDRLYIYPIFKGLSECVDYYVTEEFRYVDGTDAQKIVYKIIYTNRVNNYKIVRE